MATIKEDYVSFEVAKLLKEKGFDGAVHLYYNKLGGKIFSLNPITQNCTKAPTLQMVMRWLREVHKIFICIEFDVPTFVADIYKMDEIDEYGCAKHIPPTIANCQTYEKAVEAAIKYVLENLI